MPQFSGQVRHANQEFPVLDLTDGSSQFNQSGKSPVKGIGVFQNVSSRTAVTQRFRSKGYLAIVGSTPYVYTNASTATSDWEQDGNWTGLAATNGIPSGGLTNNVLAKTSDDDYLADWTATPIFTNATLSDDRPSLIFTSPGSDATESDDNLGSMLFRGTSRLGDSVDAAKIEVNQVGAALDNGVSTRLDFFTSSGTSPEVAFSINNEKVAIFASTSSPTAVAGGMYYDENTNSFYLGID